MRVTICQTCSVDAGHPVWSQDEVILTVADTALDLKAFAALTMAAVLHRTDDHLTIPLHSFTHTHTYEKGFYKFYSHHNHQPEYSLPSYSIYIYIVDDSFTNN